MRLERDFLRSGSGDFHLGSSGSFSSTYSGSTLGESVFYSSSGFTSAIGFSDESGRVSSLVYSIGPAYSAMSWNSVL